MAVGSGGVGSSMSIVSVWSSYRVVLIPFATLITHRSSTITVVNAVRAAPMNLLRSLRSMIVHLCQCVSGTTYAASRRYG